jgi:hypothetical protein
MPLRVRLHAYVPGPVRPPARSCAHALQPPGLPSPPPLHQPQAKKAAEAATKPAAPKKAALLDDSAEELDPTLYFENRVKFVEARKAGGANPYPHKFPVTTSIPEYIAKYQGLEAGAQLKDVKVALAGARPGPGAGSPRRRALRWRAPLRRRAAAAAGALGRSTQACSRVPNGAALGGAPAPPRPLHRVPNTHAARRPTLSPAHAAGRVYTKRASGSKLLFYDLRGEGAKVQVMADARNSDLDEDAFLALHNEAKRGDIVGVEGFPGKSQKGELSVFPVKFVVLTPCLHMPPGRSGLTNQVRARRARGRAGQQRGWPGRGGHPGRAARRKRGARHFNRPALTPVAAPPFGQAPAPPQPALSPISTRPLPPHPTPPPPHPAGDALPPALPGPDVQRAHPGHLLHARAHHPVCAPLPGRPQLPRGAALWGRGGAAALLCAVAGSAPPPPRRGHAAPRRAAPALPWPHAPPFHPSPQPTDPPAAPLQRWRRP